MGCLTSTKRAILQARIDKLDEQIDALETALDGAIVTMGVEDFRFDSGDGSQRQTNRNPKEINDLLDDLNARRDRYQRILDGTGVVSIGLRRQSGGIYGRSR